MNPHCARLAAQAEKYLCGAGRQLARSARADILTLGDMVGGCDGGGIGPKEGK